MGPLGKPPASWAVLEASWTVLEACWAVFELTRLRGAYAGLRGAYASLRGAYASLRRAYASLRGAYAPVNKEFHVNGCLSGLRHPLTDDMMVMMSIMTMIMVMMIIMVMTRPSWEYVGPSWRDLGAPRAIMRTARCMHLGISWDALRRPLGDLLGGFEYP